MQINIEHDGIETLLHTMLSCRCPVTEETERKLFEYYLLQAGKEIVDYSKVCEIADGNDVPTPVHFLRDFCAYLQDDLGEFTITHNDVLRYFCTSYHLNRMSTINPMIVRYPAKLLVSHMLVPTLVIDDGDEPYAEPTVCGHTHRENNIFISPELTIRPGTHYGLHMGVIVTELSDAQVKMMRDHLAFCKEVQFLSGFVGELDFTDFEHYGDYRANVISRYQRHFAL